MTKTKQNWIGVMMIFLPVIGVIVGFVWYLAPNPIASLGLLGRIVGFAALLGGWVWIAIKLINA